MSQKVVITGGLGFIGSNLAAAWQKKMKFWSSMIYLPARRRISLALRRSWSRAA